MISDQDHILNFERELGIEARLRKFSWVIPLATILAGTLIAGAMYYLSELFHDGYWWAFIPSGLLMHSFLIVTMHEAAHKSITRSKADRIILNISSAVMLLPMVGELFRKYHLMHHANTNLSADPLWPPVKRELYEDKRWFYILCEGVPLLFTLYLIMKSKSTQKIENTNVKSVPISIFNMVWASAISLIVLWLVQPSVWFVLGSLFVLNIGTTLRHWCEHLGTDTNREQYLLVSAGNGNR